MYDLAAPFFFWLCAPRVSARTRTPGLKAILMQCSFFSSRAAACSIPTLWSYTRPYDWAALRDVDLHDRLCKLPRRRRGVAEARFGDHVAAAAQWVPFR